jgi:Zn-dependent peptidase ImmA (M78 family)
LNTEDAGVVVMKSGIVGSNTQRPLSVVEFRGFAVVDPIAPLIFINSRDAISAQIFTLIHELAHIWIGAEGVSRPDWSKKASRQINEVEQFCNAVAAEVLVPSEKFEDLWESDKTDDENLRDLSAYFHVSQFVTLRKAYDLNRVSTTTFLGKLELFQRQERPPKSEGGNFYATLKIRNSKKITEALVQGALSGHVLYLDAAKMLNIKIGTIEKVAKKLGEQ